MISDKSKEFSDGLQGNSKCALSVKSKQNKASVIDCENVQEGFRLVECLLQISKQRTSSAEVG
jgi:hypothetical protein